MRFFYFSFFITFVGLVLAFWLGGFAAAYICALLAVLEISLSFDNAVVNAKTLEEMDEKWRRRFIVWGIPVAVFGMRFAFPIIIVAMVAKLGIVETLMLAINDVDTYHKHLSANKGEIYIFGGAFLLMVALEFFFAGRNVRWIRAIEANRVMLALAKAKNASVFIAVLVGMIMLYLTKNSDYAMAYFAAILVHMALGLVNEFLGDDEKADITNFNNNDDENVNNKITNFNNHNPNLQNQNFKSAATRSGFAGFLYLETLDASFSFDGVIGAFAMSENIFIIMIGLGIGAFFVRSLTLYMVHHGTLSEFKFLEHGANYAILALSVIMFINIFYEVSELITGTLSFGIILVAFLHSLLVRKNGA